MSEQEEPMVCHPIPSKIGQPAIRALATAGLKNLEMIAQVSEPELLALHGVGPKAIRILRSAMVEVGIEWP